MLPRDADTNLSNYYTQRNLSLCFADLHLILIFVNNQPDAQFFFLYLFIPILYMFRAPSADHQEGQLYQYGVCHCM